MILPTSLTQASAPNSPPRRPRYVPEESPGLDEDIEAEPAPEVDFEDEETGVIPDDEERVVPVRTRLAVNTAEAAIDAAIAGVGITRVLSYQAMEAFQLGKLQRLLPDFESAPMPVSTPLLSTT